MVFNVDETGLFWKRMPERRFHIQHTFLQNMMVAVDNINLSWNELTNKYLKGVWKNVWLELRKYVGSKESIVHEIITLSNETGWIISVQDIEEILQVTTGESLSN
ncbi:hypothetical protein AVEN_246183-1 [Araneus ventricosus]|uniref:DDE-1 domain-containing protein n=1 Tax=Araneus ventricosus TaxID=182803 RepID=A0A4Y2J5S6_ARAVE|nr:hypothetical protein AVEN_246183-1 [Araneus ventricosus]